ncbi:MobA/MobL family protein [Priestia megaterium]|uniref:MobA/MobL protein domain-containing protein n=1 Tax=Priestia megaterium TaxID=1404 RepID=A0A6M6DJD3_PRIMG|nr:MobA/MobL family protein [Priestia megaterium]QJX74741.1 hypothetical protein FDZ14_00550 [Priestia megaterium]
MAKKEGYYHLTSRTISRGKYNVPSRMAYSVGIEIEDENTGRKYHKEKKAEREGIETEMIVNKEASDKFKDTNYFFNKINQSEKRSDARVFYELEISLLQDLNKEENKELARHFAKGISDKYKIPVSISYHKMDTHNPHAHIIFGERSVEGEELSKKKISDFRSRHQVKNFRQIWAEQANEYLNEKNKNMFIDDRSYRERGSEKQAMRRINKYSEIQDTKELRRENRIIRIENKEIDYKEKHRVIKYEMKDRMFIAQQKLYRREVKAMAEPARSLKPKAKVVTVHKLYDKEIEKNEDTFRQKKEEHKIQRNLNKTVNKEKFKDRKQMYKERLQQSKSTIGLKKDDIRELKLSNKELKADLKGTSRLNPFQWKERKAIKRQMARNKAKMMKKRYEIRKEKTKQRLQKEKYKEHRKEYVGQKKKEYGLLKDKIASKLQGKALNREKQQVKNKQIDDKVVSLKEYKKTHKVEKIRTAERKQGRAR